MGSVTRLTMVFSAGLALVGPVAAQTPVQGGASAAAQPALLPPGDPLPCEGDPPADVGCTTFRCQDGAWVSVRRTSGACTDGDPCHYGMTCSAAGNCVGGGVAVCTGCQACNGTSSCSVKATGSSCSSVPGLATACSCSSAGACQTASGAATQTAFCWDSRGNMTAKFIVPPANSCPVSCQ